MPAIRGIETRLRKLEAARRPAGGVFFLAWGRDAAEIERAGTSARAAGSLNRGDTLVRALWTGPDDTPASRWIGERDLSPAEDDALTVEMERRLAEVKRLLAEQDGAEALVPAHAVPRDPRVAQMTDAQLIAAALEERVQ